MFILKFVANFLYANHTRTFAGLRSRIYQETMTMGAKAEI